MVDLWPRVASGVVMAAAALTALWRGGDLFFAFWLLAALVVHWEWQTLIGAPDRGSRVVIGVMAIAASVDYARAMAPELSLLFIFLGAPLLAYLAGPGRRVWAVAGLFYAWALAVSVIRLRLSLGGFDVVLWLFAVVWGTDVMAYFGGRLIGGPKLWPRVSPSKTWSGFLVGVFCGSCAGLVALATSGGLSPGAGPYVFAAGLVTAMFSQGGDLVESSIKRHFGVKDSSHLIPGHGGFMDRLDGFIAAAVFAALLGAARSGPVEIAIGVLRW